MLPYAFVLAVPDLDRSVRYFIDVLGFKPDWRDSDNWQSLTRGEVRLMLGHCPDALSPHEIGDDSYFAYLTVDDVDALHAELAAKSALILHGPGASRGAGAKWLWRLRMATALCSGSRFDDLDPGLRLRRGYDRLPLASRVGLTARCQPAPGQGGAAEEAGC